jgi:asparaginyl-tRNA synthetase
MSGARLLPLLALDPRKVAETLKNERVTECCVRLATAGGLAAPATGDDALCSKAVGTVLLALAVALSKGKDAAKADALADLAGPYIVKEELASRPHMTAFGALVETVCVGGDAVPDKAAFEAACGIGVVVSADDYKKAVSAALDEAKEGLAEKGWDLQISGPMNACRAALPFGEPGAIKKELDRQLVERLGPKPAPQKKGKQQQQKQQQGQKGKPQPKKGGAGAGAAADAGLPDALAAPADLASFDKVRRLSSAWTTAADKKVYVEGWAAHVRRQSKSCWFIDLRDGSGMLQCVLVGAVLRVKDIEEKIKRECALRVYGQVSKLPEGKHAPGGVELKVSHWAVVGPSPSDLEDIVTPESGIDTQFDQRHLVLRGQQSSALLKLRSVALQCFRRHLEEYDYYEVHPPTLTQSQAEGGSEVFSFDYFGEEAYLTQSSQLYLETVLPSMGKVYCCVSSYRAEQSRTRRHLSEYTHLEAELPFITFDDLLEAIEDLVCDTAQRVHDYVASKPELKALVDSGVVSLAPVPQRPFKRLNYADAVEYCRAHEIWKDDETKTPFEFGDDIPEAPERRMTDMIGEPVLMCRFPVEMKAFYMPKCEDDPRLTESVDLLMPTVGEIVGGSMRISDYDELMAAYKREGIDPSPYYWFTDQRKFGSCPHGGYGLGLERFLMWLLQSDHIRNLCMFPRYKGRCKP